LLKSVKKVYVQKRLEIERILCFETFSVEFLLFIETKEKYRVPENH